MMKSRIQCALALLLPLRLAACSSPEPESTDGLEGEETAGISMDLAICDGVEVDRMSDNDHCGECGNQCYAWWPDTLYTAGGCKQGACTPTWSDLRGLDPPYMSCDEVCAQWDTQCVPRGCAGWTGFLCPDDQCDVDGPGQFFPRALKRECDETVVPPKGYDPKTTNITCCCEQTADFP